MSEDEVLAARLGVKVETAANTKVVSVGPSKVKDACKEVSSLPGFYHLSTIGATDMTDRIELSYFFWRGRGFFVVRTSVPKTNPTIDSVSDILPGATLYEAEIQDLFGVSFTGSPYAGKRLLLPDSYPPDAPPPFRTEADPEKIRKMMELE